MRLGEQKIACVHALLNRTSRKKVFVEIAKCDLVCANCHFERTYQRNQPDVAQLVER